MTSGNEGHRFSALLLRVTLTKSLSLLLLLLLQCLVMILSLVGSGAGVMYKVLCAGCNECYVGETTRHFPRAYVSTCTVIGPLTFLNSY